MGSICSSGAANSKAGKAIGEPIGPTIGDPVMNKYRSALAALIVLLSFGPSPIFADDLGARRAASVRRPTVQSDAYRVIWHYDGRDDVRDFPTNGFFPGDFAANPANVAISASGLFGNAFSRPNGYHSQITVELHRERTHCARRHRSHHRGSGHRC
jgi:hypothetical protein